MRKGNRFAGASEDTARTTSGVCTGRFELSDRHSERKLPENGIHRPGVGGRPALEMPPRGVQGGHLPGELQVWEGL